MSKKDYIINKIDNIEYRTSYGKGLGEIDKLKKYIDSPLTHSANAKELEAIDELEKYLAPPTYIGADGKEYRSIEAVKIANKIYWDSMKIDTLYKDFAQQSEEKKGRSR